MATGGFDSSIKGGHDIVPDCPCNKCEESDTFTEAIAYCRHCDEKYCKVCLTYHGRFTKGHTVLGQADKDGWGKPIMSRGRRGIEVECSEHEGQDISMYCGKHDDVCCPVCAVQHHSDKCRPNMLYIRKAAQGIATTADYRRVLADNDQLTARITQTKDKKSELLTTVAESRKSCKTDAEELGKRLVKHIKSCTVRTVAQIDKLHDDVEGKLTEEIDNCADMKQKLNEIKASMQPRAPVNEASIFVTMKTSKKKINSFESSLEMLSKSQTNTFSFQGSPTFQQLFRLVTLGDCTEHASVQEIKSLAKQNHVGIQFDDISGMVTHVMDVTDEIYGHPETLQEIKSLAKQNHVGIHFDDKRGIIELSGMVTKVMDVTDKIYRIFRQADELEHLKNEANLIANITQWFFMEVFDTETRLTKYDEEINRKIEKAFQAQETTVDLVDTTGAVYVVDFSKMEDYPKTNKNDTVQVIRRELMKEGSFEPPVTWSKMRDTENLKMVHLQPYDKEYTDLVAKFQASAGHPFVVTKIERVQNKTLLQQYHAKKKQLEQQNPPNTLNERQLWHGFAVDAMDSINVHGFNRSYCGTNATYCGDGVYFAVNANYACQDTFSRPDPSGIKRVYFCNVLTGEYTQGKRGMRVPPPKKSTSQVAVYDSVVENINKPILFVLFSDTQSYPEYIISFK